MLLHSFRIKRYLNADKQGTWYDCGRIETFSPELQMCIDKEVNKQRDQRDGIFDIELVHTKEVDFIVEKPWDNPYLTLVGMRKLWEVADSRGSTTGAYYISASCNDDSIEYNNAKIHFTEYARKYRMVDTW